jgi:putative ABC transport system permease protein
MSVWFDLKYAWRLLLRSWGYALMCASVVALSVGLAVWTWSLTYSQLFKPLAFPGAERWYSVQTAPRAALSVRPSVDAYTYQELLAHNRSAHHLGAFGTQTVVLSEGEASRTLRAAAFSPRVFAAIQVAPILGRKFTEADGQPGAGAVAILEYNTWQQYFAGDPAIIGKTARIDAAPVQIIGVMPKGFIAFDDFEIWLPLQLPRLAQPGDSTMTLSPLIVLDENQDLGSIRNEMKIALDRVNGDHPRLFNSERRLELIPAHRLYTHNSGPIVSVMSLMAAAVLLLGGVNISMVFLARLLERSRELALRTALGASHGRLLRQSLLETALIVLLGLVAGYGLAALGVLWTHGISDFMTRILANGQSINMPELRLIDFGAAVLFAMVVWLLSTLIPAWRIARQDAAAVLAGSGKGATVGGSNKSVALLVGLQVVISCVVLVSAGNMVTAVDKETNKPTGLNSSQVLFSTYPTELGPRYADPASRLRYWEDLTAAIARKVPGTALAFTTAPPTRPARVPGAIETRQSTAKQGALTLPVTVVSDNYFELMGVRLRSGRLFDNTDNSDSLNVAVIDENMAARYWPDGDVLGKRVQLNDKGPWLTIVGVVSAVAGAPYRADSDLGTLYQPFRQAVPSSFHALVRLPNGAGDRRAALRAAAFAVDRDVPLHNLQTLDDFLTAMKFGTAAMVPVFLVIALITALLAASGLFGLITRSVAQRTQEVGIRRALGATAWRATSMFLRQGALYMSVAVVGLGLGIALLPMLSRAIPNILDRAVPVTLGVVLLMAVVISSASYLPTRRAVVLEPGDALRDE